MIHVRYFTPAENLPVGRLALMERKIFFEYHPEFLEKGLELSPFKLPLKPGLIPCKDLLFEGLFGVFNDSLPDGWGRLLLDRKLLKHGIMPGDLSPLDRLRYVGKSGMGALTYHPETEATHPIYLQDLDEIENEILQFQDNEDDQFVDDLLDLNSSSAGARPKIIVNLSKDSENPNTMTTENSDWIIKFRSSLDPKESGMIEYAYHLMAKAAHLDVPEARLFPSKKNVGYFGVKRFDRIGDKRLHMHTISGLLHSDHRIPSLDYNTIMKATLLLTKNVQDCEKQFKNSVFNILTHNRDDHAKNFSFLMDETGKWRVSPAYDLTFSRGPSGEHCTMILGEGKNPTLSHLLKLAEGGGLKKQRAQEIISEVQETVSKWPFFAKECGVSKSTSQRIQLSLEHVSKTFFV